MNEDNWIDLEIDYSMITALKMDEYEVTDSLEVGTPLRGAFREVDGVQYRMVGFPFPTLTNIRNISIGIQVPHDSQPFTGTVYFNDIRVAEPNTNIGYAARATFNTKFADFSTLVVDYEWRTADFNSSVNAAATNMADSYTLRASRIIII
jgi:cell surface protein SprA